MKNDDKGKFDFRAILIIMIGRGKFIMNKNKTQHHLVKIIKQSMLNDDHAQVVKVRKTGIMVNVKNRRELITSIFSAAETKSGVLNPQRYHRLRHRKI